MHEDWIAAVVGKTEIELTPRLFIPAPLAEGDSAALSAEQAHYLKNVLRRSAGDAVLLFNGKDGEFSAEILDLKKKGGLVVAGSQTRPQTPEPDLALYIAPVKRGPLETVIQKAVELGAASITPVMTERTVATRINHERLQAIATEAAEQSGRLSAPRIGASRKLDSLLRDWPAERRLMFCDEAGDDATKDWGGADGRAAPALEALKTAHRNSDQWAILIGPEGGFTPAERDALREKNFVTPVTLGPRILRADTAAIAALTLWQAVLGDWR